MEGRDAGGVGHGDAEDLADGGAGAGGVLGFDFADGGFGAVDLVAGGDFEGAAEAVEDGSGPAEVGGDAGGDFVPTGAGGGAEAVGVGDGLAGGEGLGSLAAHAVPGEGGACWARDAINYSRCRFRWGKSEWMACLCMIAWVSRLCVRAQESGSSWRPGGVRRPARPPPLGRTYRTC